MISKFRASVAALGTPLRFEINAGQVYDSKYVIPFLKGLRRARNILADMAYDADYICTFIADDLHAKAVVPSHPARAIAIPMDKNRQGAALDRVFL